MVKTEKDFYKECNKYGAKLVKMKKQWDAKQAKLKSKFSEKEIKFQFDRKKVELSQEVSKLFDKIQKRLARKKEELLKQIDSEMSEQFQSMGNNVKKYLSKTKLKWGNVRQELKNTIRQLDKGEKNEILLIETFREKEDLDLLKKSKKCVLSLQQKNKKMQEHFENYLENCTVKENKLKLTFAEIHCKNASSLRNTDLSMEQIHNNLNIINDEKPYYDNSFEDDQELNDIMQPLDNFQQDQFYKTNLMQETLPDEDNFPKKHFNNSARRVS